MLYWLSNAFVGDRPMMYLCILPLILVSCYANEPPRETDMPAVATTSHSRGHAPIRTLPAEKVAPSGCGCAGGSLSKLLKRLTAKKNVAAMLSALDVIEDVAEGVTTIVGIVNPSVAPAMAAIGAGLNVVDEMIEKLGKTNDRRQE